MVYKNLTVLKEPVRLKQMSAYNFKVGSFKI